MDMSNKFMMQNYKNIHSYNAYIPYFFRKTCFHTKNNDFLCIYTPVYAKDAVRLQSAARHL